MTRAGRAMGWKSRGLAKDSEEGKRGALEGKEGKGGGQCQEGGQKPNWRDLLRPPEAAATTWVLPNTQACCHTLLLPHTPSWCSCTHTPHLLMCFRACLWLPQCFLGRRVYIAERQASNCLSLWLVLCLLRSKSLISSQN